MYQSGNCQDGFCHQDRPRNIGISYVSVEKAGWKKFKKYLYFIGFFSLCTHSVELGAASQFNKNNSNYFNKKSKGLTRNIMAFPNVVLILLVLVPFYNFANAKIVIDSKEIVQLQDHRNLTQVPDISNGWSSIEPGSGISTSADVNNEGGSHQTNTGIGGIQIFGEDMTDEQIYTTLVDAQNVGGSHQNNVGIGGIQIFGGARNPAIIRKLVADALNREGSHQTNGAIGGILIA